MLLNLSGSFLWVFSSNLRASRLMNSVLKTHSSKLSYSCSCRIMKSSCIVLKQWTRHLARGWSPRWGDTFHIFINGIIKQLTSEDRRWLVQVTDTAILHSSRGGGVLSPMNFFTTPAFAHFATCSLLRHWLKSHILALTALPLKPVSQRSHQLQSPRKSFSSVCFAVSSVINKSAFFYERVFNYVSLQQ